MTAYSRLRTYWPYAPDITRLIQQRDVSLVVTGENEFHAKGFFTDLIKLVSVLGDTNFSLLSLDGDKSFLEFSLSTSEDEFTRIIQDGPYLGNRLPFVFGVRYQCFIGNGTWLFLSDRDEEKMYLFLQSTISNEQMQYISRIMWNISL